MSTSNVVTNLQGHQVVLQRELVEINNDLHHLHQMVARYLAHGVTLQPATDQLMLLRNEKEMYLNQVTQQLNGMQQSLQQSASLVNQLHQQSFGGGGGGVNASYVSNAGYGGGSGVNMSGTSSGVHYASAAQLPSGNASYVAQQQQQQQQQQQRTYATSAGAVYPQANNTVTFSVSPSRRATVSPSRVSRAGAAASQPRVGGSCGGNHMTCILTQPQTGFNAGGGGASPYSSSSFVAGNMSGMGGAAAQNLQPSSILGTGPPAGSVIGLHPPGTTMLTQVYAPPMNATAPYGDMAAAGVSAAATGVGGAAGGLLVTTNSSILAHSPMRDRM